MKKRDFIQKACIQFMPETQWDINKSIQYAEKLWLKIDEKGYGDPKTNGQQEIIRGYDKLEGLMKTAFDLFWLAFDYKKGKDEAAAKWLQMGELNKGEYDKIIAAAKRAATARKSLPEGQVAIMAQGWISKRRWLDSEESTTEEKERHTSQLQAEEQGLRQNLAAAKRMVELTKEQVWQDQVDQLTEKLRLLRDNNAKTQTPHH